LKKKKETWQAIRKIRQNEEEFELYPEFITKAQDIYLKAHSTLVKFVSIILSVTSINIMIQIYIKFECFNIFQQR